MIIERKLARWSTLKLRAFAQSSWPNRMNLPIGQALRHCVVLSGRAQSTRGRAVATSAVPLRMTERCTRDCQLIEPYVAGPRLR